MNEKKLISLLGIAQKAGKLISGEFAVENEIRSGKAQLLLIAADASDGAKKGYHNIARHYNVPYYEVLSKEQIGQCIGKLRRAALLITDKGFSDAILKVILD